MVWNGIKKEAEEDQCWGRTVERNRARVRERLKRNRACEMRREMDENGKKDKYPRLVQPYGQGWRVLEKAAE